MRSGVTTRFPCPTEDMASSMAWERSWMRLSRSMRAPPLTVWAWRMRWLTSSRSEGAFSRRAIPFSRSATRSDASSM